MRKISQVIKKNFKVLMRTKFSLFILLLGPILLTFLIGFFYFNSNSFAISLGIHTPDNSEFNSFFLSEIKRSQFSIFEYDSENSCENAIKSGLVHACIFLPKEFKITDSVNNDLILKLDTSRGDIVAVTENLINDQISKISRQVQIKHTNQLLNLLNNSEDLIDETNKKLTNIGETNNQLKAENEKIKVKSQSMKDLFTKSALGLDSLESKFDSLNNSIYVKTNKGISDSNTSYTKLNDAYTLLEKINSTNNDFVSAKNIIKSQRNSVDELGNNFKGIQGSTFLGQLSEIITGLDSKFSQANKDSANLGGDISYDLNENSKQLDNITSTLTIINNEGINYKNQVAALESRQAKTLMTPISVKTQNIVANSNVHLVSIFPSLIVGLIFIISLIMSSMFILTERKTKAHFRNFMSNGSAFNFFIGDFLSLFFIVFMQAGLIISLYHFWFIKSTDYVQFGNLLLMISPIIAIFVLVGMTIGFLTKNESSNVILTFLVILAFLTFSGKILPLEALSAPVAKLALLNPFLLGEGMIRKFLLFGVEMVNLKKELILIGIYCSIFILLNYVFESFSKKRFLYGLYSQFILSIKNFFIKPKPYPNIKLNKTTEGQIQSNQVNVNENIQIPIHEKVEDEVFELESLSSLNNQLKKL